MRGASLVTVAVNALSGLNVQCGRRQYAAMPSGLATRSFMSESVPGRGLSGPSTLYSHPIKLPELGTPRGQSALGAISDGGRGGTVVTPGCTDASAEPPDCIPPVLVVTAPVPVSEPEMMRPPQPIET